MFEGYKLFLIVLALTQQLIGSNFKQIVTASEMLLLCITLDFVICVCVCVCVCGFLQER